MQNETQADSPSIPSADQAAEALAEKRSGDVGAVLATRDTSELADTPGIPPLAADSILAGLPLQLDVTIPIPFFRIGDLLALEKGSVLESDWPHTEDVPIWCG